MKMHEEIKQTDSSTEKIVEQFESEGNTLHVETEIDLKLERRITYVIGGNPTVSV